ncbi:unnamed protein product, partial [Clavelina lepadiformis]
SLCYDGRQADSHKPLADDDDDDDDDAISALLMTLLTSACDGILTPVFCMSSMFFVWRRSSRSPESHSKMQLDMN